MTWSGAITCGLLLGGAVLLWPAAGAAGEALTARGASRLRRGGRRREADPFGAGPGGSRHGLATADGVADALLLLSLALRAGLDMVTALERVALLTDGDVGRHLATVAAAHRWGCDPAECWSLVPSVWRPAGVAWQAAQRAGISPGPLLARSATVIRDRESQRVEASLARAGVLLVLPLGLAFLPGFVATTVVPVVLRLVGGFLDGGLVP